MAQAITTGGSSTVREWSIEAPGAALAGDAVRRARKDGRRDTTIATCSVVTIDERACMLAPPKFKGYPQSMLVKITLPASSIELWQWGPLHDRYLKDLDAISMLVGAGYEYIPIEDGKTRHACLLSQGCDLHILVTPSGDNAELWARSEDIAHVDKCPVILAFQITDITPIRDAQLPPEVPPDMTAIPMLQFLPLPQLGEYAIIVEGDKSIFYNVAQLPEDARALWINLGDALRALAAPGQWVTSRPPMELAAHPIAYDQAMSTLRSEMLRRKGKGREDTKLAIERLEAAYEQVQLVRTAELKPDWLHSGRRYNV